MFSEATETLLNATRYDEDWEERQFQDPEISDSEDSEHWPMDDETDGSPKAISKKPDLLGNDWARVPGSFDPLNENYGTQWEGRDPNTEELSEIPETPDENFHKQIPGQEDAGSTDSEDNQKGEDSEADQHVFTLLKEISNEQWKEKLIQDLKQDPIKLTGGLRRIISQCSHWKLDCWNPQREDWATHRTTGEDIEQDIGKTIVKFTTTRSLDNISHDSHEVLNQNARVMVDSGVTGNFMDPRFQEQLKILGITKATPEPITGLNGEPLGGHLTVESGPVPMVVKGHFEYISFDVTPLGRYNVVLGIPWLRDYNPEIDWKTESLQFTKCECPRQGQMKKASEAKRRAQGQASRADAKRSRGRPTDMLTEDAEQVDTAVAVMAATKPTGKEWLARLSGWAPDTRQEYANTMATTEYNTELHEQIESWQMIDATELAASKEVQQLPDKYERFQELFEQPEKPELPEHGKHDHRIPLKDEDKVACRKIYPISEKESQILRQYIEKQLAKGYIRPLTLPAGHGVLFASKKDRSLRLTKYGHFEYLVMPFGLTNAPASFQRFINEVLGELLDTFVIAYLDDILVFSNNEEEHIRHVKQVLRKLRITKLRLKLKKCEFHVQETEFLGHWITTEGVHMERSKVQAIRDWPVPKSLKEVQQFTGLINYYRRFIDGYAKSMVPIFNLLKQNQKFEWITQAQQAFDDVKRRITTAPILVQHDLEKLTTIETDASDYAIGMRMTQPDENGRAKPIAFHLRKLIQAEMNYDIHDKELLAIVTAFKV
ncbi:retropepsin-like aspartic protease/reverse transcriptase [Aspergillus affinis]|uniref:retropepsin-like aspartic protease/reverse transcriptase n=1 Tax=Aspergillus affinis TaxID=1070780 RepID=UPI0022FE95B2|nr:uncharacterized protein KD926_005473 [Aspergillus affinis]KAI9034793.1 hypothetical protein KD926_005473 [Aspergillus affinis]